MDTPKTKKMRELHVRIAKTWEKLRERLDQIPSVPSGKTL